MLNKENIDILNNSVYTINKLLYIIEYQLDLIDNKHKFNKLVQNKQIEQKTTRHIMPHPTNASIQTCIAHKKLVASSTTSLRSEPPAVSKRTVCTVIREHVRRRLHPVPRRAPRRRPSLFGRTPSTATHCHSRCCEPSSSFTSSARPPRPPPAPAARRRSARTRAAALPETRRTTWIRCQA